MTTPPTPLWLLPGMDGTGLLFSRLLASLDSCWAPRVLAYDSRIASYDALLDRLPSPDVPTVLVAESFGGPLAIRVARRDPERVQHVVLVASFVRPPRAFLRAASALIARLPTPPPAVVRAAMVGSDASDELVTEVRHAIASTPRATLAARLEVLASLDLSDEVRALAVPLTALVATRDRLVPKEIAAAPAQLVPHGEVIAIDGPHLLAQRRPEDVARVLGTIRRL